MAAMTHVCAINHTAEMLGEDPELLTAIVYNDDNLTYGNIATVYAGREEAIRAWTDDGIEELKNMLIWARVSEME